MRHLGVFVALLLAGGCVWPWVAQGQVAVNARAERAIYTQYEQVVLIVSLQNFSGNALDFGPVGAAAELNKGDVLRGPAAGYVRLLVKAPNGRELPLLINDFNPVRSLRLAAGASHQVKIPLDLLVDLTAEGQYQLTVRAGHQRFTDEYTSPPVYFTIRQPLEVKDFDGKPVKLLIGVPSQVPNAPIEQRTCSLVFFNTENGQTCALRVANKDMVQRVVRLGPYLRGTRPQLQGDARGLVHVMLDIHPRITGYWVFDTDGRLKQESFLRLDKESLALLTRDPDLGRVMVTGATLAEEGRDYSLGGPATMTASGPGTDFHEDWMKRTVEERDDHEKKTLFDK